MAVEMVFSLEWPWTKRFLFPGIQYSQLMDGGTEILFVFLGELNKMKVNK